MISTRDYCQILMKPEFSRQIFGRYSNLNFHEKPFTGIRGFPCGRARRHDKTNRFFYVILLIRLKAVPNPPGSNKRPCSHSYLSCVNIRC
jgi:hypothetical protein